MQTTHVDPALDLQPDDVIVPFEMPAILRGHPVERAVAKTLRETYATLHTMADEAFVQIVKQQEHQVALLAADLEAQRNVKH